MKDQLYYDGNCALCAREIKLLKQHTSSPLEFVDIHQLPDFGAHTKQSPSHKELLKRLHLQKANGEWLTGLDANVYIWSSKPIGKALKILRWPLIRPVADLIYQTWADRRYNKRYECSSCKTTKIKASEPPLDKP